jgi:archaemetzincin
VQVSVIILPVGRPPADALATLAADLRAAGFDAALSEPVALIPKAFDRLRNQYRADDVLESLPGRSGKCVLGVSDADFYVDGLNFVFGIAGREGRAVISLARLGMGADAQRARERALKEAVHEIYHTLGLQHCSDRRCVMYFSNSLADTDRKAARLCALCQAGMDDEDARERNG